MEGSVSERSDEGGPPPGSGSGSPPGGGNGPPPPPHMGPATSPHGFPPHGAGGGGGGYFMHHPHGPQYGSMAGFGGGGGGNGPDPGKYGGYPHGAYPPGFGGQPPPGAGHGPPPPHYGGGPMHPGFPPGHPGPYGYGRPPGGWFGGYEQQPYFQQPPQQQGPPGMMMQRGGAKMASSGPRNPGRGAGAASVSSSVSPKPGDDEKSETSKSKPELSAKKMEDLEAERQKAAALAEQMLQEVKPIQTDFHFFVQKLRSTLLIRAREEVAKSSPGAEDDPYLVNSNLNARLMKAWEDLPKEDRATYAQMEEEDRCRFMEEDEVASRHCFTLTARQRSPLKKESPTRAKGSKKGFDDDGEGSPEMEDGPKKQYLKSESGSPTNYGVDDEEEDRNDQERAGPHGRSRLVSGVKEESEQQQPSKLSPDNNNNKSSNKSNKSNNPKRSPSKPSEDEESPSKKNRVDEAINIASV